MFFFFLKSNFCQKFLKLWIFDICEIQPTLIYTNQVTQISAKNPEFWKLYQRIKKILNWVFGRNMDFWHRAHYGKIQFLVQNQFLSIISILARKIWC